MAKNKVIQPTLSTTKRKGDPKDKNLSIKENFPEILCKAMGIVTNACKNAGICRDTYYDWRNSDPEFAAKCDKAHEYAGDFVESKLYELINDKNPASVIFYCKTKLSGRGYMEKKEILMPGHEDALKKLKDAGENTH